MKPQKVFPSAVTFTSRVLASVLALAGLCALPAYSQIEIRPGVRGGPALMTIADLPGEVERRTGLSAGAFATVDMGGPFALQPEVLYVQKGAESGEAAVVPETGMLVFIRRDIEADYIELPVLGTLRMPGVPLVTPTVTAGPTVGLNVRSRRRITVTDQFGREQDVTPSPPTLGVNDVEAGLLVGLGAEMDTGAVAVSVSEPYRLGLTDLSDGGENGPDLGPNGGFAVTADVSF